MTSETKGVLIMMVPVLEMMVVVTVLGRVVWWKSVVEVCAGSMWWESAWWLFCGGSVWRKCVVVVLWRKCVAEVCGGSCVWWKHVTAVRDKNKPKRVIHAFLK